MTFLGKLSVKYMSNSILSGGLFIYFFGTQNSYHTENVKLIAINFQVYHNKNIPHTVGEEEKEKHIYKQKDLNI